MKLMILVFSLLISLLIVCGQAMWKWAVSDIDKNNIKLFSSEGIVHLLLNPKLLFGTIVYAIATVSYIYMLSRYNYFQVQSIVVGGSLVITLIVAVTFFSERPSLVNIIGVCLIVLGSVFVVSR
jgi:drug/metabolite transporter (DMT)-like permease